MKSFQISLTDTNSEIIREYNPDGIQLNGPYEVGLKHFVFWNTIYNITEENNTLALGEMREPDPNTNDILPYNLHIVTISPGYYELDEIIKHLKDDPLIKTSKTTIEIVKQYLKIKIKSTFQIDFTRENSIGKVLGFSKQLIPSNKATLSDLPINIFSINTVKVHCNLVCSNIEDLKRNTNVVYDCPLDLDKIGGKVIKEPNPICYFYVNADIIYELVIKITDQDNKLIDFHGEEINLTLDFRPIK